MHIHIIEAYTTFCYCFVASLARAVRCYLLRSLVSDNVPVTSCGDTQTNDFVHHSLFSLFCFTSGLLSDMTLLIFRDECGVVAVSWNNSTRYVDYKQKLILINSCA